MTTGLEGLAQAVGGTLCVWADRKPADFRQLIEDHRKPRTNVLLIICSRKRLDETLATPILVPRLTKRTADLPRIVAEFADDATSVLSLPRAAFSTSDHAWVVDHEAASFTSIERATLYLTALRHHANFFSRAARMLDVSDTALRKWLDGRRLPS